MPEPTTEYTYRGPVSGFTLRAEGKPDRYVALAPGKTYEAGADFPADLKQIQTMIARGLLVPVEPPAKPAPAPAAPAPKHEDK